MTNRHCLRRRGLELKLAERPGAPRIPSAHVTTSIGPKGDFGQKRKQRIQKNRRKTRVQAPSAEVNSALAPAPSAQANSRRHGTKVTGPREIEGMWWSGRFGAGGGEQHPSGCASKSPSGESSREQVRKVRKRGKWGGGGGLGRFRPGSSTGPGFRAEIWDLWHSWPLECYFPQLPHQVSDQPWLNIIVSLF